MKNTKEIIFNPDDVNEQFRNLSRDQVLGTIEKLLNQTINSSEDAVTGLIGTVALADGREARVELKIDAEYIVKSQESNNLELFPQVKL